MKTERSQYQIWTREALPALFHREPEAFLTYARDKKEDFFKFWWEQVAKQNADLPTEPFMAIRIRVDDTILGQMVRLWLPPRSDYESFSWLAFLQKPKKRFQWLPLPRTRVVALQSRGLSGELTLVEITPRLRVVPFKNQSISERLTDADLDLLCGLLK